MESKYEMISKAIRSPIERIAIASYFMNQKLEKYGLDAVLSRKTHGEEIMRLACRKEIDDQRMLENLIEGLREYRENQEPEE